MEKYAVVYDRRVPMSGYSSNKFTLETRVEKFDNFMAAVRRARDISAQGQSSNSPIIEHR